MQKVLILVTGRRNLRDTVIAAVAEDGSLVFLTTPVTDIKALDVPDYQTPLHALGDGWKLLGPPLSNEKGITEWWMTQDV